MKNKKPPQSPKLQLMLQLYVDNGGDAVKAYADAGYAEENSGKAKALVRENWQHIQDLIIQKVGGHAPFALDAIVKLAGEAKSETVRLNAAKDLLSRAGYDAALRIESKVDSVEEMDEKEIEAEILALLQKSGTDTSKLIISKETH